MKSISVKIKKEDKAVFVKLIDRKLVLLKQATDTSLKKIVATFIIQDVLYNYRLKLRGDSALRLNSLEVFFFMHLLEEYSELGVYEDTNANLLLGEIMKKVNDKFS